MLVGNTRDEGKLFPTLLPLAGGTGSGRLLNDATVFSIVYNYNPNAAPQSTLEQWIPAAYLPGDDAGHRVQRAHRQADPDLLPEQPRQRAGGSADAAEATSGTTGSTGTRSRRRST